MTIFTQALAETDLKTWRHDKEARLKADDGWLTVVGLSWLDEGENTVGAAFSSDVRLPSGSPKNLGFITRTGKKASINFTTVKDVKLDGEQVDKDTDYTLNTDADDKYSTITIGKIKVFIIDRKNGLGVRVKDQNAQARKKFKGLNWYPEKKDMKIKAKWVAYKEPKTLMVPDILGNINEEEAYGYAEFQLGGKSHKLYPSGGPEQLFFVFKDPTNGKETYKASRFLYTDGPKKGYVILDFNRAYNPPCAFTDYATCPRAPKKNILKVAIRAGEKKQ